MKGKQAEGCEPDGVESILRHSRRTLVKPGRSFRYRTPLREFDGGRHNHGRSRLRRRPRKVRRALLRRVLFEAVPGRAGPHRSCGADTVAVQNVHNLPYGLLFGPGSTGDVVAVRGLEAQPLGWKPVPR